MPFSRFWVVGVALAGVALVAVTVPSPRSAAATPARDGGTVTLAVHGALRVAAARARESLAGGEETWGAALPGPRAAKPVAQKDGAPGGPGSEASTTAPEEARLAVERKLARLGYPTGSVDGTYTADTRRAMCAWRETHGLRGGRYGVGADDVRSVLEASARPGTSRLDGIYVNKSCQVLYQVLNGTYRRISAVSTGQPGYDTPNGTGRVWRTWPGWHGSSLYPGAQMLDSIYFLRERPGIALHGSISDDLVETYPASHGCVRVPQAVIAEIFDETRVGTLVRVYGQY